MTSNNKKKCKDKEFSYAVEKSKQVLSRLKFETMKIFKQIFRGVIMQLMVSNLICFLSADLPSLIGSGNLM